MAHRQGTLRAAETAPNPMLLAVCGWVGTAGAAGVVLSNIIGSVIVPDYHWMADTISDLAAGKYEIIQDVGLYAFAGSLMACALGASNAHPGTDRWSVGVIAVSLMSALVVAIAARNEYGDSDATSTWGVHLGLVYALMLLFLATTLLMARGLGNTRRRYRTGSLICAVLFIIAAGAYFASPTGYDGLIERILALVAIGWVLMVSWMLLEIRGAFVR